MRLRRGETVPAPLSRTDSELFGGGGLSASSAAPELLGLTPTRKLERLPGRIIPQRQSTSSV